MSQEGVGFDNDEDEDVSTACCQATNNASHFLWVDLSNHDPWYDQETESASYCEDKDACHREPGCSWSDWRVRRVPLVFEI